MKIQETSNYKKTLKYIEDAKADIKFLTALKESECGRRIKEFCSHKVKYIPSVDEYDGFDGTVFCPTEEYKGIVEVDPDENNTIIRVKVPETNSKFFYERSENGDGFDIDDDIKEREGYIEGYLEEKEIYDECTIDVTKEDALEFYEKLLDRFQNDEQWKIQPHYFKNCFNVKNYLKVQACFKYGIAKDIDGFSIVIPGRDLYIIDGEVYKASPREIGIYCKATGKTARKVEPKYLKEVK